MTALMPVNDFLDLSHSSSERFTYTRFQNRYHFTRTRYHFTAPLTRASAFGYARDAVACPAHVMGQLWDSYGTEQKIKQQRGENGKVLIQGLHHTNPGTQKEGPPRSIWPTLTQIRML